MSSSSSVPDASLRTLLASSFDALAREIPQAYSRMCSELDGRSVSLRVDDESVVATFRGGEARVVTESETVTAEFETTRRTILAVLDGELALADAVLSNAVTAKASLDELVRLNGALAIYMHGAVRAPSFPALLQRFRPVGLAANRRMS